MSSKLCLVTGATGLLGRQVVKAFEKEGWKVTGTGFSRSGPSILKLDLGSEAQVSKALDEIRPQVVVHCAANRFPDKCDNDPAGTRALNIEASRSLAKATSSRGIFLIYISTDYVFPGTEGDAPYETTATPRPTNLYGETKLGGEKAVLEEYKTAGKDGMAVVLRVPVLYGEAESPKESAVNVLLESVWNAREETACIKMDHWAIRYPTNTEDVGRVCKDIAEKYLSTEDKTTLPSILQFSSEDRFTKYEMCEIFAGTLGLSIANIKPNTEGNDPNATVQRPYDCHLSTRALKDLGIPVHCNEFRKWWERELQTV